MSTTRSTLRLSELLGTATQSLASRRLRAGLSALGIAIGIGAMVAVVGIADSAKANLIAELDTLGTNLLTVTPGTTLRGDEAVLPATSVPMIHSVSGVRSSAATYQLTSIKAYRNPHVPSEQTGGIGVAAATGDLPRVVGARMTSGRFPGRIAGRYPEAVLGAQAAETLQLTKTRGHVLVYLSDRWFSVIGIMSSATLDTSLDSDVFISLPVAQEVFGAKPNPSTIYVRANPDDVAAVADLLAATANPQHPAGVQVSRPSDALRARAAAKAQFTTLLLALGAVALLVGAIGIANLMVIGVLERRAEIGLRRSLGAARRHIAAQFLAEAGILAILGGLAGLAYGACAIWIYSVTRHEPFVLPLYALVGAPAAGLLIGSTAGLYPAIKAARVSPTEALRAG
jgi:putative ABC transport system permease protein